MNSLVGGAKVRVRELTIGCAPLTIAMAAALTVCTAVPPTNTDSRSTTPASVPVAPGTAARSPADQARHDATAAYVAMWSDVAVAAVTSDWKTPRLARHAAGNALSTLSRAMFSDHQRGLVSRGEPSNSPSASSARPPDNPTTVLLSDCGDSTHWLKYDAKTGELSSDSLGGRRMITAEVKREQDGTWKVHRFAVGGLGTC